MNDLITTTFFSILAAGFFVGIVVGLTGMGGGALMTPALIFLGVGDAATVVTADLTAAAIYKTGGAVVHAREGSPNLALAKWLILGSVPMALLGPVPRRRRSPTPSRALDDAAQDVHRLRAAARRGDVRPAPLHQPAPGARRRRRRATRTRTSARCPTLLVGALGGLLVGITSVGSGSVIMIALLMLYPGLSAVKLVGTDLVQAVPLVLAAAISNIALHGLDWELLIPLVLGSVPGTILGSKIAPRVPQSFIRRGIVVVLTMSGVALLDKAGWAPLGAGEDETHPVLIAGIGLAMLVAGPAGLGPAAQGAGPADVRRPDRRRARGPGVRPGAVALGDARHAPRVGGPSPPSGTGRPATLSADSPGPTPSPIRCPLLSPTRGPQSNGHSQPLRTPTTS